MRNHHNPWFAHERRFTAECAEEAAAYERRRRDADTYYVLGPIPPELLPRAWLYEEPVEVYEQVIVTEFTMPVDE